MRLIFNGGRAVIFSFIYFFVSNGWKVKMLILRSTVAECILPWQTPPLFHFVMWYLATGVCCAYAYSTILFHIFSFFSVCYERRFKGKFPSPNTCE